MQFKTLLYPFYCISLSKDESIINGSAYDSWEKKLLL